MYDWNLILYFSKKNKEIKNLKNGVEKSALGPQFIHTTKRFESNTYRKLNSNENADFETSKVQKATAIKTLFSSIRLNNVL